MNDVILSMNASAGQRAAEKVIGLEAKVKASMAAVIQEDWMATNDDGLFRAGVGGALLDVGQDSDDGRKLIESIDLLKKVSAFLNASSAGLSVGLDSIPAVEDALPLIRWWHEVKDSLRLPKKERK